MNLIKYLSNWYRLKTVEVTINKYRIYGQPKVILKYKPLLRRPRVMVLRNKVNGTTYGLLVASMLSKNSRITYIDFIWVNKRKCSNIIDDAESLFYQVLYENFMKWHEDLVIAPIKRTKTRYGDDEKKISFEIAIIINTSNAEQIERFRRILTIHGFNVNRQLTIADIEFTTPYREHEKNYKVVYTKNV